MRPRISTICLTGIVTAIFATGAARGQVAFLMDAETAAPRAALTAPEIHQRYVDVDLAALRPLEDREEQVVRFDLIGDARPIGDVTEYVRNDADSVSMLGSIRDVPGGNFILTRHRGVVFARVDLGDAGLYEIRATPVGPHEVVQLDATAFKTCASDHAAVPPNALRRQKAQSAGAAPRSGEGVTPRADDGSRQDVLMLYTATARAAAGSVDAIESANITAINLTNSSYGNSLINPRLRIVHQQEVAYTESGSAGTDLGRLQNPTDGFMDEAHSLRNTHGADLVALIVNSFDACGIAYLLADFHPGYESLAFSVTARGCAVANLTLAHEIGHNQGCCHAVGDGGGCNDGGLYSYSVGWRFNTSGGLKRTIMAYDPGTRINHFSNPDVTFLGVPTGVPVGQPNEAHNVQTINNTAVLVAQYRLGLPDDFDPPDPNPLTWANLPAAQTTASIGMTTTVAVDAEHPPVQYSFEELTGNPGASNSGWIPVNSYVDNGLAANTIYGYRARARDSENIPNSGGYTIDAFVATHIQTPGFIATTELTTNSVRLTAAGTYTNLNLGMSAIYFEVQEPGDFGGLDVWQQSQVCDVTGLLPGRTYHFRAKARNQDGVETPWSSIVEVTTFTIFGDCNDDGFFTMEEDVECFVNALLGIDEPVGAIERCDFNFDGETNALDMPDFIYCLIEGC